MNPFLYRNQYLISNQIIEKHTILDGWRKTSMKEQALQIYTHPNLEVHYACNEKTEIVLLGFILDAENPDFDNTAILNELLKHTDFSSFLKATACLAGRYVLLYKDATTFNIFTDALGFREVYFHFRQGAIWIANQSHFLKNFIDLEAQSTKNYLDFINSYVFKNLDSAFYGDETPFHYTYHLLPNHYLDLLAHKAVRYFPIEDLPQIKMEDTLAWLAHKMKGILKSAKRRFSLAIPLTAGWDSRLTAASSKDLKEEIQYFVNKYPSYDNKHPDILIPYRLSEKLQLNFQINDIANNQHYKQEEFQEFKSVFQQNYTFHNPKYIPTHYLLYKKYPDATVVLSTGSEIVRDSYSIHLPNRKVSNKLLAELEMHQKTPYILEEMQKWLDNLADAQKLNIPFLDLYYWEQRVGNWGASNSTHADMYRETLSLFNCRELLLKMLSIDRRYRHHYDCKLYKELMRKLWAEILSEPINPTRNFQTKAKIYLDKLGFYSPVRMILHKIKR